MDPYEVLGIAPGYEGDLRAVRNLLVKRFFEAGETPDEERMKAINVAYALLSDPARRRPAGRPGSDPARRRRPAGRLQIVTGALPPARAGEPYGARLAATGGAAPYAWAAVLPAGLTLDGAGAIAGRPERTGSFPVTIDVADRDGRMAQRHLVLHVDPAPLRLIAEALPNATVGVPYAAWLRAEGGVPPLRWAADLPAGLEMGDGLIFGTPLGPSAAHAAAVRVRDAARQAASASLPLVVRPAAAAGDPTRWTPERLADEQHAQAVAAHEAGLDVGATRARIAALDRRLARRPLDPAAIAAASLASAAAAGGLALLVGAVAIAIAAAVLAYAIGPALLAPARRAERDRLRARLGCGQEGCPRCPQPGRNREAPAGNRP